MKTEKYMSSLDGQKRNEKVETMANLESQRESMWLRMVAFL